MNCAAIIHIGQGKDFSSWKFLACYNMPIFWINPRLPQDEFVSSSIFKGRNKIIKLFGEDVKSVVCYEPFVFLAEVILLALALNFFLG